MPLNPQASLKLLLDFKDVKEWLMTIIFLQLNYSVFIFVPYGKDAAYMLDLSSLPFHLKCSLYFSASKFTATNIVKVVFILYYVVVKQFPTQVTGGAGFFPGRSAYHCSDVSTTVFFLELVNTRPFKERWPPGSEFL